MGLTDVVLIYLVGVAITLATGLVGARHVIKSGKVRRGDDETALALALFGFVVFWPIAVPVVIVFHLWEKFCDAARRAGDHE